MNISILWKVNTIIIPGYYLCSHHKYYSIDWLNIIKWIIGCIQGHHLGEGTSPYEGGHVIVNWAWLVCAEMCGLFGTSHIRVGGAACVPQGATGVARDVGATGYLGWAGLWGVYPGEGLERPLGTVYVTLPRGATPNE